MKDQTAFKRFNRYLMFAGLLATIIGMMSAFAELAGGPEVSLSHSLAVSYFWMGVTFAVTLPPLTLWAWLRR